MRCVYVHKYVLVIYSICVSLRCVRLGPQGREAVRSGSSKTPSISPPPPSFPEHGMAKIHAPAASSPPEASLEAPGQGSLREDYGQSSGIDRHAGRQTAQPQATILETFSPSSLCERRLGRGLAGKPRNPLAASPPLWLPA